MKKSELLREAKKHLNTGSEEDIKTRFVCIAIKTASKSLSENNSESALSLELKHWITRSLLEDSGDYEVLECWMKKHHLDIFNEITALEDSLKAWQELRFRWIDWMVTYWEEKGE